MNNRGRQVLLRKPKEVVIQQVDIPVPGLNEVVVKVEKVGICGSDVHAYHGKHPFIPIPIVLGHEFSGTVHAVGQGVANVQTGLRVIVDPTLACGHCPGCLQGRPSICNELRLTGCQTPGAYADYVAVPASSLVPLPEHVSFTEGVFVEPFAVGVHACRRAKLKPGSRIGIIGAGTIGLMTALAARQIGAEKIVLFDVSEEKCEFARILGFEAGTSRTDDPANLIRNWFPSGGPDVLFECVGIQDTIRLCIEGAPKGGTIIVVGVYGSDVSVPMALVQDRELELYGTLTYSRSDFEESLQWIAAGKVPVEDLISRSFALDDAADAFRYIDENRSTAIKVLLSPKP